MRILHCLLLLLLGWGSHAQEASLKGDWILDLQEKNSHLLEIIKIEPFLGDYYAGVIEGEEHSSLLIKIRVSLIQGKQFIFLQSLEEQFFPLLCYEVSQLTSDSMVLSTMNYGAVELGQEDRFNQQGHMITIDTVQWATYIQEEGVFSNEEEKEVSNKKQEKPQRRLELDKSPLLLEQLLKKYSSMTSREPSKLTLHRWSYFTWDKMNVLKSKDIVKVIELEARAVRAIFETASIDSLLQLKSWVQSPEKLLMIKREWSAYHKVRAHSFPFFKGANYYIVQFKNGQQLKIKTNRGNRGLYDVSRGQWYYNKEATYW